MIGSPNAAVLPVPVCACPITSRPRAAAGSPAPGSGWATRSRRRAARRGCSRTGRARRRLAIVSGSAYPCTAVEVARTPGRPRRRSCRRIEQQLARRAALARSTCACAASRQRVGRADDRAQLAARGSREQVGQRARRTSRGARGSASARSRHGARVAQQRAACAARSARCVGDPVDDEPPEGRERARRTARSTSPPAISKTTSTGRAVVRLEQPLGQPVGRGVDGDVGAELERQRALVLRSRRVAITRPAPSGRPSWTASEPTPPAAECTTTLSPAATRAAVRYRCHAVIPWISERERRAVVEPSGIA